MEYRNESKYFINKQDYEILDFKLKNIMKLDNLAIKKEYNIRSIYFDSLYNKCFYENDAGANERFKIRIRVYNKSYDDIKLEIKYKKNGFTKKEYCNITKELCKKLISGKNLEYSECNNKVLRKLFIEQKTNLFTPKIIIEYNRIAYVEPVGNVRITLDKNIRASKHIEKLFDTNIFARPIINDNIDILEVKYNEILPKYIYDTLNLGNLEKLSVSKYYLSRSVFKEEIL